MSFITSPNDPETLKLYTHASAGMSFKELLAAKHPTAWVGACTSLSLLLGPFLVMKKTDTIRPHLFIQPVMLAVSCHSV